VDGKESVAWPIVITPGPEEERPGGYAETDSEARVWERANMSIGLPMELLWKLAPTVA